MRNEFGEMSYPLFKKIIDDYPSNRFLFLNIGFTGEPTLHKNLPQFISYAKRRKNIYVKISTNALLLDDELISELIMSGLDEITCSMQGVSGKDYEMIRFPGKYSDFIHNVSRIKTVRNEFERSNPCVTLYTTILPAQEKLLKTFFQFWRLRVDVVNYAYTSFLRFDQTPKIVPNKLKCHDARRRMTINHKGHVVICCEDVNGDFMLGDLNRNQIKDIWLSSKFQKIRKILAVNKNKIPLCRGCLYDALYKD